jgi:hypothetical protein
MVVRISKIVDGNSLMKDLTYSAFMEIKKFEENDFAYRLKVKYEFVSMNATLKENLYCIFVCMMNCTPLMMVGGPGCSKSLALQIICDYFSGESDDEWLQRFPKVAEFFIHESYSAESIERKYKSAQ